MTPVTEEEFLAACARGRVSVADPGLGIGRELHHDGAPLRVLVIYIGDKVTDEYRERVTDAVFAAEPEWYLFQRYGVVDQLGLLDQNSHGAAVRFSSSEKGELSRYLNARPDRTAAAMGSTADLYVLSRSGAVLLTWDHHSRDEGLAVSIRDVATATSILGALNDFAVECSVFYANSEA